jgi:hypothetical protein
MDYYPSIDSLIYFPLYSYSSYDSSVLLRLRLFYTVKDIHRLSIFSSHMSRFFIVEVELLIIEILSFGIYRGYIAMIICKRYMRIIEVGSDIRVWSDVWSDLEDIDLYYFSVDPHYHIYRVWLIIGVSLYKENHILYSIYNTIESISQTVDFFGDLRIVEFNFNAYFQLQSSDEFIEDLTSDWIR